MTHPIVDGIATAAGTIGGQPGAPRTVAPPARVFGIEHECKWPLDYEAVAEDPGALLQADVFPDVLDSLSELMCATQAIVYLDDPGRNLTNAGHSLRIAANQGRLASVGWIGVKQTLLWNGRRDALEIAERVAPAELATVLGSGQALPLRHIRSCGLVEGPLTAAGITYQRRTKRFGTTCDGSTCAFGVDLVEFRAPGRDIAPLGRYACLEIEVNSSAPSCLATLDALAEQVDGWLHVPRETRIKAQLAVAAADGWRPPGR